MSESHEICDTLMFHDTAVVEVAASVNFKVALVELRPCSKYTIITKKWGKLQIDRDKH